MGANLLADPSLWTDDAGNCPPSYWDGEKYAFDSGSGGTHGGPAQYITCNRAAAEGETADATMDNLVAITYPQSNVIVSLQDTADVNPDSPFYAGTGHDLTTVGTWSIGTGALLGGEIIQVYADSQFTSGYAYDFTLTPPQPVVAPDESLTVTQGSSDNSVTPAITQGSSSVTPDSLAIIAQPEHGTASVDGVSLVYAPASGYFGNDAFTYQASVGGTESNLATVSVTVNALPPPSSIRQQTTHRAYRHYDSPITCYVRNEDGRLDLSAATLEVCVRNLNRQWRALRTLSATGDANGVVSFTIPKGTFYAGTMGADYQLGAGDRRANNFKFEITANGALIYDALLEVV